MGRGCTGGVWVRGVGGWGNDDSEAWVRKGEAGRESDAVVMEGGVSGVVMLLVFNIKHNASV